MPRRSSGKARKRAARTGSPWAAGASAAGRGWRRGILRALTAVVALGLLGSGAAGTTAASAGTTTAVGAGCTRMVTGVHHGALAAGFGVLCLDRATQFGPVRVWPGASLKVTASVISGAVTTIRARSVRICGSTIIGPLRASVTAGPVTAGAGGASCRGDIGHGRVVISGSARRVQVTGLRQQGPVTLSGNAAAVTLSGASVAGTVTVRGNRGHGQLVISANAVSGSLVCAANQPAPGDRHRPNTVSGTASGQCRTLVPTPPRRRALPPLPQDESSTLPNLNYGQAVGDFTGTGHDQLAYAQDSQLKIADVSKFGGAVHSAIPTDLMATPNDGLDTNTPLGPSHVSVWENDCIISSYCGQLRNNGATYGLTSVKVAASASDIYMAGATWDGSDPADSYQLHLYKLSHDGSCAIASCAEKKVSLPSIFNGPSGPSRLIVVTSLATGVVGGRTLIAVGLSDRASALPPAPPTSPAGSRSDQAAAAMSSRPSRQPLPATARFARPPLSRSIRGRDQQPSLSRFPLSCPLSCPVSRGRRGSNSANTRSWTTFGHACSISTAPGQTTSVRIRSGSACRTQKPAISGSASVTDPAIEPSRATDRATITSPPTQPIDENIAVGVKRSRGPTPTWAREAHQPPRTWLPTCLVHRELGKRGSDDPGDFNGSGAPSGSEDFTLTLNSNVGLTVNGPSNALIDPSDAAGD